MSAFEAASRSMGSSKQTAHYDDLIWWSTEHIRKAVEKQWIHSCSRRRRRGNTGADQGPLCQLHKY